MGVEAEGEACLARELGGGGGEGEVEGEGEVADEGPASFQSPEAVFEALKAAMAADEVTTPAFRVEAELVDALPGLRPGMQGVAKVSVGERRRWWIWTHALSDWLSLQLWRWQP
mgnify:CR=1 FL=1